MPAQKPCNITLSKTVKYLGVPVDEHFAWKEHIININNKLRKAIFAQYHINKSAPISVAKQSYFALAESHIRHGITAFGYSHHCKILQQSQNRMIKQLVNNFHEKQTNNTHNIYNIETFYKNHNIFKINNI